MMPLFFGLKRAHLRAVHITRRVIRESTLTPARFDLLRIVAYRRSIRQRVLRDLLGVSSATVSKMLRGLYLAGAIFKVPDERDGRQRIVVMTPVGEDMLDRAFGHGVASRVGDQMVAASVLYQRVPPLQALDSRKVRRATFALEDLLLKMRITWRDPSTVRHPWRSDDLVNMQLHPFERDARPAEIPPGCSASRREPQRAAHEIAMLWDAPRGYIPPAPESWGLIVPDCERVHMRIGRGRRRCSAEKPPIKSVYGPWGGLELDRQTGAYRLAADL